MNLFILFGVSQWSQASIYRITVKFTSCLYNLCNNLLILQATLSAVSYIILFAYETDSWIIHVAL